MPQAQTYQSEFTGLEMDARFTAVAQLTAALEALTTVVAQKYVKPASGIPSTDMDADVQAALAKANTAVQSLADYYTKSEVDQLLAAINGMDYVDVATLPTASASTLGKIYLVGPDGSGYYAYYYTSYDGSAYSWVGPLGTTQISLANYATKAELSQLDQEVGNLFKSTDADFAISDGHGFSIAEFLDGHIKTKNFDSSTVFASPLARKKVAFIGDSITAGNNASPSTKKFTTVFCGLAGCTEKNLGVAATCIANNTLNEMSSSRFITRATGTNLSDQDLIFVWGGTNDFSYDSKPIGEPFNIATITADTYIGDKKKTAPSDTDTFSGALHELILQIRSVAPSAQLVFITPLTRGRYSAGRPTSAECNQHGDFLQDFTDTIKTVCSFYSVPVVDMGVMMGQFWANDGNGTFGSYDDDGIHPNTAGHERIAKLLFNWCRNNLIF